MHPARILDERNAAESSGAEPVYGLTEGVSSRLVGKYVATALARVPALPEWQDPEFLRRNAFPDVATALRQLHEPEHPSPPLEGEVADAKRLTEGDSPPGPRDVRREGNPARRRLAYDEFLASQLALALVRHRRKRLPGRANAGDGSLVARVVAALPFALTGAQERAVAEIRTDLSGPDRMLRLLQGDVGSGWSRSSRWRRPSRRDVRRRSWHRPRSWRASTLSASRRWRTRRASRSRS